MGIEKWKKLGVKNFVLLLLGGILLLCCSLPNRFSKTQEAKTDLQQLPTATPMPYRAEEERLISLLSAVEGAGRVDAMIVYQSCEEISSYVSKNNRMLPEGVVIVAEGGKRSEVVKLLSDATEALFGIPKHKIVVLPMRKEGGSNGTK